MSSSFIPTEFGDTPTKVVLSGAALGSGQTQALYNQIAGEVSAFLGKARQNRLISGQPSSSMQQARPNGGSFRYQYLNGQETVFVTLSAPEISYAKELPPEFPVLTAPPLLAIDVLIHPRKQLVGNINSYRYETLPGHPDGGPGTDPHDQPNFVQFYSNTEPPEHFPDSDFWNYYDKNSGTVTVNWGPGIAYLGGSSYKFGPDLPDYDPETEIKGFHPSGTHADATGTDWNYIFVYRWQSARSNAGFGPKPNIYLYWDCIAAWNRTTPAGGNQQVRKDQNEQRTYYNMLDVVGAKVVPEGSNDPPYSADSLGATTDKRLVPLMDGARVVVTRNLAFSDGDHPWMGAGFLAKPLKDFVPGQTPPKVPIDIYLAQTNVIQKNTPGSAQPNSSFGADDGGMTWSMDPLEVLFEVQVRELVDVSPYVVQVNLKGEGQIVRSGFASGNGTTYLATAREQSWRFAATGGWVDSRPDPADPAGVDAKGSPAMGKLLDSSGEAARMVATIMPAPRQMLDHVVWPAGVDGMTKVASIVWEPTNTPHQHGKAKITLL